MKMSYQYKIRMHDGFLKNSIRGFIKLINKHKHDKYVKKVREESKDIQQFSLLTSDCMAGLIYHTMGRRFLSPTINMSIEDRDFLKFLTNMDYYLEQNLVFGEKVHYPIGYLGEGDRRIRICFEHYKTENEAKEKWEERKKRLQFNNIFIVVADRNLSEEEIDTFKHLDEYISIKRKVMFTWNKNHADNKEVFLVDSYGRERIKNWSKIRKDGFRDYELFFDYVAWIKMQENFMK